MKKRALLLFLPVFLPALLFSQAQANADSVWIRANYKKTERTITMRDGVKLFTAIYTPKDVSQKHPVLMTRTPYSCAPYGENNLRPFWNSYINAYFRRNYIMVIQDVRGRWMSEGNFTDVRPFISNKKAIKDIDEASDTYDAIDWLVKNVPGNNGNVGVFGISYPGFYSTMAAASGHPALKAVSPQAPVTDWFTGDDFHHNGAFMVMDGFQFYSSFGKPRPLPTSTGPAEFDFYTRDNYKFYLETGPLPNFAKLMGDSILFWKDLYAHPDYDDWWKARNARVALYNIKPAMLVVGGLFDAEDCFGAWNVYKALEKQSPATNTKIVMGPWYHGQWARGEGSNLGNIRFGSKTSEWYEQNIEIPFFDYYLAGKGADPALAEATIFFTGENEWRKLPQWPPANVSMQTIYLHDGGNASWSKPAGTNSFSEYVSDPAHPVPYTGEVHFHRTREYMTDDQRFASRRSDVLTFQTDTLQQDITLAGPVTATLKVSTSTTDADFVVKLIDVFPDQFRYPGNPEPAYPMGGYEMLVRGDIMRGRYRNSFSTPEAFTPGVPTEVNFTMPDIAHTFKKGHRLMVQVQSSWFPLADRNPQQFVNIYEARETDFKKATIRVYHDAANSSGISLPVLR